MKIGEKIRTIREERGFTQANVARYLGVDQSLISKIENDERSMTSDMLKNLSDLFGVESRTILATDTQKTKTICAFRANELDNEDLKTIAVINRIALNADFMSKLLED